MNSISLEKEFEEYRKTLGRKIVFGSSPSYKEQLSISEKPSVVMFLMSKAIMSLGWGLYYFSEEELSGVRLSKKGKSLEAIFISVKDLTTIEITSSQEKGLIDVGTNYRNVKMILYAYQKVIKGNHRDVFKKAEEELIAAHAWSEYVYPESITPPVPLVPDTRKFLTYLTLAQLPECLLMIASFIWFPVGVIVISIIHFFSCSWKLSKLSFVWQKINFNEEKKFTTIAIVLSIIPFLLMVALYILGYLNDSEDTNLFLLVSPASCIWVVYITIPAEIEATKSEQLPEEVSDLAYFLKHKKKMNSVQIKQELQKFGWKNDTLNTLLIDSIPDDGIMYLDYSKEFSQ